MKISHPILCLSLLLAILLCTSLAFLPANRTPLLVTDAALSDRLASLSPFAASASQPEAAPDDDTAPAAAAAPAAVLANDDLSNLQLDDPSLPVYDPYTLAQRRAAGLTTALPEIIPYKQGKVVYLTFDDGPDDTNTPAILDILKENHIPATFYVLGRYAKLHPDMVQRMYDEHHAIGNHSYDHIYQKLYASPQAFLAEMEQTDAIIQAIIGVRPLILRAPGGIIGHFNASYPPALKANGYVEHDWNVSSADAAPNHPVAQDFIDNIKGETENRSFAIILMHCSAGHEETVKALPEIIRILKERGFTFGVVTPMTPQPW
jgi:peptidoglycan/xylan/chitin deacetylase (PgdA/CDA1 family)